MKTPVDYQRIEGAAVFLASLYFYHHLHFNIVIFVLVLFTFDIFMLGYLINNKVGAHAYNVGHSLIISPLLLIIGVAADNRFVLALSLIWIAHIGFDRAFGYGLKFTTSFADTHLGHIGKQK